MNFQTILEELDRLYEELPAKEATKEEAEEVEESEVVEACDTKALTEEADDEEIEIVDDEAAEEVADEAPEEEPAVEEIQLVLECAKCGALVVKPSADVVVDEESDLANVEDECQFCEEKEGYTIIGTLAPYEAPEAELEEGIFGKKKQDALDAELDPYKDNYWVCMYKPNGAKKYVYAQTPTANKNRALARHKELMSSNPEYKPYVCTYAEAQKASGSRYYESLEESDSVEEGIFDFGKKKKSANNKASGASESRVTISIYDENGTKKFAHTFTEIPGKMNAEDQFNELIKSNGVLRQFKASSKKSDWSYERKSEPASPRDTDKYFNAASKIIREQLDEVDQAEELEELLDFDLDVPVSVTANGNDVAVGGLA